MSRRIQEPDPQHVMLDALNEAIDTAAAACEKAGIDRYEIESCWPDLNEETGHRGYQSVVFDGDPYEAGYDDPDEYREIVMAVGARDLDIKIEEAKKTLRNLNDLLDPPSEEDDEDEG